MKYTTNKDGKLVEVYDIETALQHVKASYQEIVEENQRLRERIKFLEEEYSKDVEIQKYKEAAEKARREANNGFPIADYINKKIDKWKEQHIRAKHWDAIHDCEMSSGAIGGRFIYEFQPTSIGTLVTCKCCCGECISEMED